MVSGAFAGGPGFGVGTGATPSAAVMNRITRNITVSTARGPADN
jgi:hypothetical protein